MLHDLPPAVVAALAEAPLAIVLLWMVAQLRRDLHARPDATPAPSPTATHSEEAGRAVQAARDELSAFKLEVARTYVPLSVIRDLDARLTRQLDRFEEKLDEVSRAATAAAAVSGRGVPPHGIGFGLRGQGPEA
jgi:hypothetical protein